MKKDLPEWEAGKWARDDFADDGYNEALQDLLKN